MLPLSVSALYPARVPLTDTQTRGIKLLVALGLALILVAVAYSARHSIKEHSWIQTAYALGGAVLVFGIFVHFYLPKVQPLLPLGYSIQPDAGRYAERQVIIDEIVPGFLFSGSAMSIDTVAGGHQHFDRILCLTQVREDISRRVALPITNVRYGETLQEHIEFFQSSADRIHNTFQTKQIIFVCCDTAMNNSPAVIAYYFMHYHRWSLSDAVRFLQHKATKVVIGYPLMSLLSFFEKEGRWPTESEYANAPKSGGREVIKALLRASPGEIPWPQED